MRLRLMDAAIECLVELGYAGTSTTVVSERAGVSRGAQLHHFPSKAALLAGAVDHLTQVRMDELLSRADEVASADRRTVLEILAGHFTSDVFSAALELWVAARTDPELRAVVEPVELRIGRQTHEMAVVALRADESIPGTRELVQATLDMVRGLGLASAFGDDARRRSVVLDRWAEVLDNELVSRRAASSASGARSAGKSSSADSASLASSARSASGARSAATVRPKDRG